MSLGARRRAGRPPRFAARRPARGRESPKNARGGRVARWRGRSGCADLLGANPPYHHAGEEEEGGRGSEDATVLSDEMQHLLPIAPEREPEITDCTVPYGRGAADGERGASRGNAKGASKWRDQGANARN